MSNFTDLTIAGSSFSDRSIRGDIDRVALGELYDSNVNAFNFNELILNDVVLIKNTNVGLVDNTGSSDAFSDEGNVTVTVFDGQILFDATDVMVDGVIWHDNFSKKTNTLTTWSDLT